MAATLTLTVATPYALKFRFFYDGTGGAGSGVASRTQAQLITDCGGAAGPNPLEDLLTNVPSDGAWGLLDESAKLSLSTNITTDAAAQTSVTADLEVVGPNRLLRVIAKDGNAATAIIELRFHHTFDR